MTTEPLHQFPLSEEQEQEQITISVPISGTRAKRSRGRGGDGRRQKRGDGDDDWDVSMEDNDPGDLTLVTRGAKRRAISMMDDVAPVSKKANPLHTPSAKPPSDANHMLKFTYGINAWKQWVNQKNTDIKQQVAIKGRTDIIQFNTDLLQCTAYEINTGLAMFVQEVRKPNKEEYAPDSILYLCLGEIHDHYVIVDTIPDIDMVMLAIDRFSYVVCESVGDYKTVYTVTVSCLFLFHRNPTIFI